MVRENGRTLTVIPIMQPIIPPRWIRVMPASSPPFRLFRTFLGLLSFVIFNVQSQAEENELALPENGSAIQLAQFEQAAFCDVDCAPIGGIYANVEFLFARAHYKESFEASTIDFLTGTQQLHPFSFDYSLSPRAALGFRTGEGLGLRATWWGYDDESKARSRTATFTQFPIANVVTVIFPAAIGATLPGDVLDSMSSMKAQTLDLEGTVDLYWGQTEISIGGGVRLASMDQRSHAHVTRGTDVIRSLDWSREMDAAGPTVGVDGRRSLATLGRSQLSLFGGLQGSLVLGENTLQRVVVGDITPMAAMTPPRVILSGANEVSGIFDMALGMELSQEFGKMGRGFVRGQYDAQLWTAAGAPTLTFLGFEGFGLALGWER